MIGYIYLCEYNNKYYIGESINAKNPRYLGKGKLWLETITGHESEVKKTILETIEDIDRKSLKQKMHNREIYWINKYDTTNLEKGYNISPGGNLMAESSIIKMKETDSKTMKRLMSTTDIPKRISKTLSNYRNTYGFSKDHLSKISKALKGRKIGCNGDSRSINVYCIINNTKYSFHNKITAAKWWYDNYPFSNKYAEITYTRLITKSINNLSLTFNGKPINQNIKWYEEVFDLNENTPVYCIYDNNKYEFNNMIDAITWWHENYPLKNSEFNKERYITKLIKNIKGYIIEYQSIQYNNIKWYRKENNL